MSDRSGDYKLEVERVGGLAGFGLAGSRIRSRGQVERSRLSPADRQSVDALFEKPAPVSAPVADGFRYRLTRHTADGPQTVEVASQHVPEAVQDAVTDQLA